MTFEEENKDDIKPILHNYYGNFLECCYYEKYLEILSYCNYDDNVYKL